MLSAIIDGVLGRLQKGMSAGIDVANSQNGDADSILSDEEAKESNNVSAKTAAANTASGWRKKARSYATNLSKGFANAGAIATGQGEQYEIERPSIVNFDKDTTKDSKDESN